MRRIVFFFLLLAAPLASWAQCTPELVAFAAGAFTYQCEEESSTVEVPNVVGEAEADADTALEAVGLDTGNTFMRCSGEAMGDVVEQNPVSGTIVDTGTLVDLYLSTGDACAGLHRRLILRLEVSP